MCQGKTSEADKKLNSVLDKNPDDYFALSLRDFFLPARLNANAKAVTSQFTEAMPQNEIKRLDLARSLMHLESKDIERIQDLLAFHSKNPKVEALRLFSLGGLMESTDPNAERDRVLKLYEEAFQVYGELEPSMLHPLVVAGEDSDYSRSLQALYRPMINEIPKADPWRDYLHLEVKLMDEEIGFVEALGPIREIKERCPIDLQFRYSYGIIASYSGHPQLAYDEFSNLAKTIEPWAGLYFYWGTSASSLEKYNEALRYFSLAEAKGPWLRSQYQEAIDEWKPFIQDVMDQKEKLMLITIGACVALVAFALFAFFVLRSIYQKLKREPKSKGSSEAWTQNR